MVTLTTIFIFAVGSAVLYQFFKLAATKAVIGGACMAFAFVLPHLWFTKETDGYLPLFTIVLCAVYALFALGLNIVVGFAGLLDLGYVAFFLVGAYVGAWFMSDFAVNVSSGWRNVNFHFFDAASHCSKSLSFCATKIIRMCACCSPHGRQRGLGSVMRSTCSRNTVPRSKFS